MPLHIITDTETNGLIKKYDASIFNTSNFPEVLSVSWIIFDSISGEIKEKKHYLIKQRLDFVYNKEAGAVHNITEQELEEKGIDYKIVMQDFIQDLYITDNIFGYNIPFDIKIIMSNFLRYIDNDYFNISSLNVIRRKKKICVMRMLNTIGYNKGKWLKLTFLYDKLFGEEFPAHNSLEDCVATLKCYMKLKKDYGEIVDFKRFEK